MKATILPGWRVAVWQSLLLADGWKVAHDLDGRDVAGEHDEAALPLPDSRLHVLQPVADVRLVLGALLDALVQLKRAIKRDIILI